MDLQHHFPTKIDSWEFSFCLPALLGCSFFKQWIKSSSVPPFAKFKSQYLNDFMFSLDSWDIWSPFWEIWDIHIEKYVWNIWNISYWYIYWDILIYILRNMYEIYEIHEMYEIYILRNMKPLSGKGLHIPTFSKLMDTFTKLLIIQFGHRHFKWVIPTYIRCLNLFCAPTWMITLSTFISFKYFLTLSVIWHS